MCYHHVVFICLQIINVIASDFLYITKYSILFSTSQGLELLCHMYIERCHTSWKEPNALAWLEAGVNNVLEITEKKEDNRIKTYAKMLVRLSS